ncbi:matrixin family metalloprotease [Cellulomonas sp.]|uniref:matrixin family metalloprotease n=1 Tax=Cellulomonas sp. TaxID=40001 RepID=UPI001B0652B4|nr:matrixin family metalloprotease [Cellulomonas sp.]MBO9554381.1 matrixin family metalloprotease [Cellulomonas sp.]
MSGGQRFDGVGGAPGGLPPVPPAVPTTTYPAAYPPPPASAHAAGYPPPYPFVLEAMSPPVPSSRAAPPAPFGDPRFLPLPPARRRRSRVVPMLVAGAILAAVLLGGRSWLSGALPSYGPPAGLEEARLPLGAPPPESVLDTGAYAFSAMQPDGSGPVTYSPCRPIHYVVRPDHAPEGADALLAAAVERVAHATGLQFVADGPTDEAPDPDRAAYQPDRYGKRWAPVLIAWSNAAETPSLAGDVAGTGGSAALTHDGRSTYVTGAVTIDADELTRLLATPNGRGVATGVITHELGHLVGLAHVDDPTQLMYPTTNMAVTSFAAGDRAGLALLGAGACARDV